MQLIEKKPENAVTFINATQQLIEEVGLENVSARKIADRTGFHNSTIFLYFDSLDELTMLASMKYFQDYSKALSSLSQQPGTPEDTFIKIWEIFLDESMTYPNIFYHFFYGNESEDLTETITLYYQLFPEEREKFSDVIESMYFGHNITERSMRILEPLLDRGHLVTADNIHMINEIIVSYTKYKLEKKCQNPKLDSDTLTQDILQVITYLTGI